MINLFQDYPDKNLDQGQIDSESLMRSGTTSSVSSGPIAIPGSPARPSPSRQSSRDSLESLEEGDEGIIYLHIHWVIFCYFDYSL